MGAAGVRLLSGIEKLDIIGVPSLSELRRAIDVLKKLSHHIANGSFDVVVFIDNPGLNLRLSRVAKRAGKRVVYYVAPQIWAWNEGRIEKLRRYVDRLLVILPFEEAYFKKAEIDCVFVGNPIMDELQPMYDSVSLRKEFGLDPRGKVIGLLPGSRESEIKRLLPPMLDAAQRLTKAEGQRRLFVMALAPTVPETLVEPLVSRSGVLVTRITDRAYDVIASCDALMVASGTATLQTALVGRPMTIVYRMSALSAILARWFIKVPWIGLANLVAGRKIAKELLQNEVTGKRLAFETEALLADPNALSQAEEIGRELRAKFGPRRASDKAAEEIMALIASARDGSSDSDGSRACRRQTDPLYKITKN